MTTELNNLQEKADYIEIKDSWIKSVGTRQPGWVQ